MSNEDECLVPRMSEAQREARRAWFAEHFPAYTWNTSVKATQSDVGAIVAAIQESLRTQGSRGAGMV